MERLALASKKGRFFMKNNRRCGKMLTQAKVIASRHEIGILAKNLLFTTGQKMNGSPQFYLITVFPKDFLPPSLSCPHPRVPAQGEMKRSREQLRKTSKPWRKSNHA
jgi:hypothetical protein